jgi:glycosyltransferase involved in cell wall biosynthesis
MSRGLPKHSILFVESGASAGGSFESLYQHLLVINRQRFRPVVVYLNQNPFVELVKALDIPVYLLTDWRYSKQVPRQIRKKMAQLVSGIDKRAPIFSLMVTRGVHFGLTQALARIIQEEQIDLIHLNDQISRDFFGLFVARRTKTKCISHLRSMDGATFHRRKATYANHIVSAYIANSKSTQQYWEAKGIDGSKTWLVYNALPEMAIQPLDLQQTWGIEEGKYLIGCVGRLVEWKGHKFLFRAFAQFVRRCPNSILLVVGDGRTKDELVQQAALLGIKQQLLFTGYEKRAKEIMAALDLLVLPSDGEPFGRVLIEAMQVGTAIVATKSGGIPEIVTDEYNGLLVEYGDEEGLSQAMERVLTNDALRARFVENGYQTARERFSIEQYASEMERIYHQVLE